MKYYIGNVLGHRDPSGHAAEKGTIVHCVLEIIGQIKKANQDGEDKITNDELGEMDAPHVDDLDTDALFEKVYNYFVDKSDHTYLDKHKKECLKWTNVVLESDEDPRKLDIIDTEHFFEIDIKEKWAQYDYNLNDKPEKGFFKVRGIIDLVTRVDENTIKFIDWKGLPTDTPIPTLDGWKTMGTLVNGDILFDINGKQTKVMAKSKKSYKDCYRIYFDDKTEVVADFEHQWLLDDGRVVDTPCLKEGDRISLPGPLCIEHKNLPEVNKNFIYSRENVRPFLRASQEQRANFFKKADLKKIHPEDWRELQLTLSVNPDSSEVCRTILKVEKLSIQLETQCIKVDSPTSTFLCTKHMIPTHNTGQRKDWVTGEKKTMAKLYEDIQLNIYHYCLRKLYPEVDNIHVCIFYTKDGGPFDLVFNKEAAAETEQKLKRRFHFVKAISLPKRNKSWRCKKFCYFSKLKFDDASNETKSRQLDKIGDKQCACSHIHQEIKLYGIDHVTETRKKAKK